MDDPRPGPRHHTAATDVPAAAGRPTEPPGLPASRKPTYDLVGLLRDAGAVLARADDVVAVWARHRVDPAEREAVMAVVARANECRWCSFVHRTWAREVGLDARELEAAVGLRWEDLDQTRRTRLAWSWARSVSAFGAVPTSVERAARAELDARERDDLDLVARVMTIANRAGNSLDTILARLARRPSGRRLTAGEAVAGVAFAASVVPALGTFSVLWRRAPWSIARDFVAFSSAFAAEVAGEAGPAPVPPPARR